MTFPEGRSDATRDSYRPRSTQRDSLDWLVSKFAREVSGVTHAVLVSADGLLMAASEHMPIERADQLAAVASGLASLSTGAVAAVRRRPRAAVGRRDGERLPAADAGRGRVQPRDAGHPGCDIGQIGYEMAILVERVGSRRPVVAASPPALVSSRWTNSDSRDPADRTEPGSAVHADGRAHRLARRPPLEAPVEAVVSDKPRRWPGNDVRARSARCARQPVGGRDRRSSIVTARRGARADR